MHEVFRTFGIPKRMDKWRSTIRMMHVCQKGNQVLRQKINIYTYNSSDFFQLPQCTEVRFASFLSGGFTTMAVINSPEKKLAKRTSVQWKMDRK